VGPSVFKKGDGCDHDDVESDVPSPAILTCFPNIISSLFVYIPVGGGTRSGGAAGGGRGIHWAGLAYAYGRERDSRQRMCI
jgi:hypothetical protein